jgi:hypothetical protein
LTKSQIFDENKTEPKDRGLNNERKRLKLKVGGEREKHPLVFSLLTSIVKKELTRLLESAEDKTVLHTS